MNFPVSHETYQHERSTSPPSQSSFSWEESVEENSFEHFFLSPSLKQTFS